jgi:hypothetical protein
VSVAAESVEGWLDQLALRPADVAAVLAELESSMRQRVEAVVERAAAGEQVIPQVAFADIVAGTVPGSTAAAIRACGCAVVLGTFDRGEAEAWDAELGDYVDRNRFWQRLVERYPAAAEGSRIWPIYWSRPQVLARQHPRMDVVRAFLNSFWRHQSAATTWFDPAHDIGYPDRIRRRQPGATARGLGPHIDSPAAGGWRIPENQRVFAPLLTGGLAAYDAFDAAHRTDIDVESPVSCTVFRTFQGWTALSEMHPSDGVLHVVPIPEAVGYRLVRGVAGELGLLDGGPVPAPSRDAGDHLLLRAMLPIPAVHPGDTVWWHGDLYHAVADATNDTRWGNVMYIGAAPGCPRNDIYAATMLARFESGASPLDFPVDDFEADFAGRATVADLNPVGRLQFGLDRRPA